MWIKNTVYSLLRVESGREVKDHTDLEHDLGMDSLDIMNLLMEIEDTYNITISLNSLSKVKTANDLITAIVNSQEGQFRYQGLTLRGGGLCPEQYEAYDSTSNIVGYLRLRHGNFTVECPDVGGEEVLCGTPIGYGGFEENERDEWLRKAITAINAWRDRQAQYKLL